MIWSIKDLMIGIFDIFGIESLWDSSISLMNSDVYAIAWYSAES